MVETELPSIKSTMETCPGCDKELNLLQEHLKVDVKPERAVVVTQPLSEYQAIVSGEPRSAKAILAAGQEDVMEKTVSYLGSQSGTGAGIFVRVHNFDCLRKLAADRKDDEIEIRKFRPDDDHYENVGRSNK